MVVVVIIVIVLLALAYRDRDKRMKRNPKDSWPKMTGPNPVYIVCCPNCNCAHSFSEYEHAVLCRATSGKVSAECTSCAHPVSIPMLKADFSAGLPYSGSTPSFQFFKHKQ